MKQRASKLDVYAERLEEWFLSGKTLADAQAELALDGCRVSLGRLSVWWEQRQAQLQEEKLLEQIATGADTQKKIEEEFRKNPAPETETLIKVFRVLIMKLSVQANVDPKMLELVARLAKPTLDHAKLKVKVDEVELARRKYEDQVAERKRLLEDGLSKAKASGGISDETFAFVEGQLKLL